MAASSLGMLPVSEGPLPTSAKHLLDIVERFMHASQSEWLFLREL